MDLNSMTRVVGNQRIPCVVVDATTGERLHRHAVDAKEMIASQPDRFSWAHDVQSIKVPEIKVDAHGAPIALVDVPMPPFVPSVELVEVATSPEAAVEVAKSKAQKGKGKAAK